MVLTLEEQRYLEKDSTNVEKKLTAKGIFKGIQKGSSKLSSSIATGKPTNLRVLQARPQTILSKEQKMLGALFNDKNQLWGNGEPVVIEKTLQTGGGLIKTGTGDKTRRLFLP